MGRECGRGQGEAGRGPGRYRAEGLWPEKVREGAEVV